MATYKQANRPISVKTPLGEDVLLLVGITGNEGISELFSFELDLLAEDSSKVKFDKLLGQPITVTLNLPGEEEEERYFNGVCRWVSEGARGDTFTSYRMEIVPKLWFLTRTKRSRIFQHMTVPDILKKVFEKLDVAPEIKGDFHPRDFCVQYRETDFNFASRLMEEEGIFYFFKHTANGHKLVLANTSESHAKLEKPDTIIYDEIGGGLREENRIYGWEKTQELRSGKYTLWDHCFELPDKNLEAQETILEQVQAGIIDHKLKVGGNEEFEIYDYPGAYAQRFDGVDKSGGDQSSDLSKIFKDNERTTKIRMNQETLPSLVIRGSSNCRHFVSGYKFNLKRHFDADGEYVLTAVNHTASLSGADYRSGEGGEFVYENGFTCIPFSLPFVPPQIAVKPTVRGTQTAVVVGPDGEEIFTDKYGRVKVQFNWDRDGQSDADSSCWVRVAHPWAGKKWGTFTIPRIGMEVVVDFLEGDPDRPLIVGCVYNADMMPPYELPGEKTKSTTKTMSSKGGEGFNEIRFEDKKGSEQVFIHAEKDLDLRVENDRRVFIGGNKADKPIGDDHLIVKRDKRKQIERDEENIIKRDQIEEIGRDHHLKINGKEAIAIDGSHSFTVSGDVNEKFSQNHNEEAGQAIHIKAGMKLILEAGAQLSLKVGGNFIDLGPAGIAITGTPTVLINSGGAAGSGPGATVVKPTAPKQAEIADHANPGSLAESYKSQRAAMSSSQAAAAEAPWHNPNEEENKQKKSWIEIELMDEANKPVPGEAYRVTLPDGTTLAEGTLDEKGFARVDGIDPGTCKVTFPNLDKDAWQPK
jgi:type VI secretion system secreted protein VgrG